MNLICKKKNCLLLAGTILFFSGFSQSLYPPKVESPNAASLGLFGDIPVSPNTGTPDISIPLHTLKFGSIQVPIALRYHNASVKPGQHPGWVGSGWDLESIGTISRQVRGIIDEEYADDTYDGNIRAYYPFPSTSSQANAANFGSYLANIYPWYMTSQLGYDFFPNDCQGIDVEADEFSFNVLGHSGKFYYGGVSKGWVVASDENIKVEMTDFYSPTEVGNAIHDFSLTNGQTWEVPALHQSRQFGSFTLTLPDGTKFIFGGKNGANVPDAAEFISETGNTTVPNYQANPIMIANTWLLKQIIDPYGNQVTFAYVRKYPTCVKSYIANDYGYTVSGSSCFASHNGGQVYDRNKLGGIFQWPMYLNAITCPTENIYFYTSDAVCNRYTNAMLSYVDQSVTNSPNVDNSILGAVWPDMLNNLQWEKLDKMVVTDNMHNSSGINNYAPNIIRQFTFTYSNTATQRLMLGSLQLVDQQNGIVGQYQFNYNSDFTTYMGTPVYADGNYSDHWGFFNATSLPATGDFSIFKGPNSTAVTTELLNKITYPTGGYTVFTWEANDYSQLVPVTKQAPLTASNGYGSGTRIAEIKSFLADGTVAADKKFYYKTGYNSGATISSLPSSGVLNGTPVYHYSFNRPGTFGILTFGGGSTSFSGVGNYSYAGHGEAVGYKEVVEVNADGSYIRHLFTSYDADINGVSHWDVAPNNVLGFNPSTDTYCQFSSLELERGKEIATYEYTGSDVLSRKTINTFRNDAQRFGINPINLIDNTSCYRSFDLVLINPPWGQEFGTVDCSQDGIVFASAHQVYTYSYYPATTTVTTYDQQGNNPITQTTTFTYNQNNLIASKTVANSKNESLVTSYKYPTDYTDATSTAMMNAHILTPVIETATTNNGTQVFLSHMNFSQPSTGLFVASSLQAQIGSNTIETRQQVNQFDAKGHILEIQKTNGVKEVYIYGCNSQYVMAKIIGSDYATASALINQTMLDQAGAGYNNYSNADVRTELNKLRTGLPNALVTTYTYVCGVGLSSETDPAGRTVYYEYDPYGRMLDIRDQDYNVVKRYCYNYAGQPDNCTATGFTNDQQQGTFTSTVTCGAGTTPATYTYTVPAGTFTSFVDKASANQMAVAALNTNGQAVANTLPCLAAFSDLNTTTAPWNVTLTNTVTGATATYSVYPNSSSTVLANIPVGTYNISWAPMYSGSVTSNINLIFNGTTYSGMSFSVNSVNITTAIGFTLQNINNGPCSFTMFSGFTSPTNNINHTTTTASFSIVWSSTMNITPGSNPQVATVNGACRPSTLQTIPYTSSGRTWTITIYPSGAMFWQLSVTSPTLNAGSTIATSTLTYNL